MPPPKMRPNFALYGAAAAVALVALATVAETAYAKYPSSYESDYGHVDEYNTNDYKHEAAYAKYLSSYESDDYKHEPSYGSHYEEDYGYEKYTPSHYKPSHYKPKYSMAPSYKHQPSYMHKRSVEYGSPYGSQSYKHKQSVGFGSPREYATRPSYRHRRAILGHHQSQQNVDDVSPGAKVSDLIGTFTDGFSSQIQAHADRKKAKVDFVKKLFSKRSVDSEREGKQSVSVTLVREGQQFFLLPALGAGAASAIGGEASHQLGIVDAFGEGVDELGNFFGSLFSRRSVDSEREGLIHTKPHHMKPHHMKSVDSEREGQSLSHMNEQLAMGLMDCPVAEGGEPDCGCECSPFWYWQGAEKNGDCNKLSDLGIPFCYLYSPNNCKQAHASTLVPNGKWKHCV